MNERVSKKKSNGRGGALLLIVLIALSAVVMGAVLTTKPSSTSLAVATNADPKAQLKTVNVPVQGMSCVSCAATVKKGLTSLDGVSEAKVSLEKRSAEVRYDDKKTSPEKIRAKVEAMGFKSGPPETGNKK